MSSLFGSRFGRQSVIVVLVLFGAVWLASLAFWPDPTRTCPQGGAPIKIMPLGDSHTDGHNVPGGYRIDLWKRLVADDLCVDFVGSEFNGPRTLPDRHHEGHSGWRIDQITDSVAEWLNRWRPDIVLLMIGGRDLARNDTLDSAPGRLGALLDRILQSGPETRVVVASIPPLADPDLLRRARTFNEALPAIVASKGARVSYVDAFAALDQADLDTDGIHLIVGGYEKLAAVWHAAIRSLVTR